MSAVFYAFAGAAASSSYYRGIPFISFFGIVFPNEILSILSLSRLLLILLLLYLSFFFRPSFTISLRILLDSFVYNYILYIFQDLVVLRTCHLTAFSSSGLCVHFILADSFVSMTQNLHFDVICQLLHVFFCSINNIFHYLLFTSVCC